MKRVLLTGASGFIGTHCITALVERGFEVHTASRRPLSFDSARVQTHQVDLLDSKQHRALLEAVAPSHLLHLAWTMKPGGLLYVDPENYAWVAASFNLVREFVELGGKRLVVGGSSAEYDWRYGYCSESITPLVPETVYGTCKHALQLLISSFANQTNLSSAWARVFFSYGPHEHPARFVASIIRSLLGDRPAPCSHGQQIRDYLHIQDIASALVSLLESDLRGPVNIASGQAVTLERIATTIGQLLGKPELIRLGALPARSNDHAMVVGRNERLVSELAWSPSFDLLSGLQNTIDWWERNPPNPERA
ncbi:MAG TPA: NAD(P)-dependent oxidoreductase [Polyangiaceae bacterium]|nr:NAD(P)-dependent oxidoreductase [Polyangiaceae bacterium]